MSWNLDAIVQTELGDDISKDRVITNLGWICCKNTNIFIGPKYLVSFNHPTLIDEIEFIKQFSRKSSIELIKDFYRSCNGMRVFGNNFCVPGVRISPDGSNELDFFNVPLGFETMGGIELPAHSPFSGFMIGTSQFRSRDGSTEKLYDIVDSEGCILSGYFDSSNAVVEKNVNIENWLIARVRKAKEEYEYSINSVSW